jgi:ABC-type sugar transport system substrate-binding protein
MSSSRRLNVNIGVIPLVLLVAAVLVAGCGSSSSSSTTSSSSGGATNAAAASSTSTTKSVSLSGKKICYGSPANIDVMNEMFNNITKAAAKSGVKVQVVNANLNFAMQLSQMQQFLASGQCNAIGAVTSTTPSTAPAWAQLAKQAEAKGVVFANFSANWITGASPNVSNPHCPGGSAVAKIAAAWYKKYGNGGEVGMLTAPDNAELLTRTSCFQKTFQSLVGRPVKFWTAADNMGGVSDSAAATASLLQAHPNINVMFGWGSDTSVGIPTAVKEAGHTDPHKFFVGAMDLYAPSIAALATGKTVLQGGTVFDYDYAGVSWNYAIEQAMLGKKIPPTAVAEPVVLTSANAGQLATNDANVISNPNQAFFGQAMQYCDVARTSIDPFPAASDCKADPTYYAPPS